MLDFIITCLATVALCHLSFRLGCGLARVAYHLTARADLED
jgi:hypothetical protein